MAVRHDQDLIIWRHVIATANTVEEILELDNGATCLIKSMCKADSEIHISTTASKTESNYFTLKYGEAVSLRCRKKIGDNPKIKIFAVCNDPDTVIEIIQINTDDSFLSFSQ